MIEGYNPMLQALLGTLFTWGLTAAGSALVFVFATSQRKILDGSLGFAAGVMLAASYWSLLAPAIDMAEESKLYGNHVYIPVAAGFAFGAFFVYFADIALQRMGVADNVVVALGKDSKREDLLQRSPDKNDALVEGGSNVRQRKGTSNNGCVKNSKNGCEETNTVQTQVSWKRILLLVIAITIHNIPEGLAVGVGFAAVGKTKSASFSNARNLAIGIGIQNFPEGLAVSLPLRGAGVGIWRSFWYGQLSGMVEPIAGILGAIALSIAEPLLPYALAFAAGAMVFVVNDDIIPEAQMYGNGKLASLMSIIGFIVMMTLDVGLG